MLCTYYIYQPDLCIVMLMWQIWQTEGQFLKIFLARKMSFAKVFLSQIIQIAELTFS